MPRSFPGARLEHIRCEERSLSQRPECHSKRERVLVPRALARLDVTRVA
jgi:hypothetical protein